MLINILVLISTIFGFMALYYGFRNWVLIKGNRLWNTSCIAFLLTAVGIGARRLYSWQYESQHLIVEYFLVLGISIGAFIFAFAKSRFFEKYLADIKAERDEKTFAKKEELIKAKEKGR